MVRKSTQWFERVYNGKKEYTMVGKSIQW